ncbi:MAG: hypothetical protein LKM31_08025 [Sphingobium sp.]|nr:hypothetical protein [Sphingobium sp.]
MKLRFPLSPPRSEDGTMLPAVLAVLLLATAGAQLLMAGDEGLPEEGVGRIAPVVPASSDMTYGAPPAIILTRPLFSPTRSLAARPLSVGGEADFGPLQGAVPVGTIARGRRAVLFLRLPDGTARTMTLGSGYLGWRLAAIGSDAATFAQANQRITIKYGSTAPVAAQRSDDEEEDSSDE